MDESRTRIEQDVAEELIFDPGVTEGNIRITSSDEGVVTLEGTIGTLSEFDRATWDAWRVYGVSGVDNELMVDLPDYYRRDDTRIAEAANFALFWNVSVPEEAISVSVDDGRVSLEGEVGYLYQRQAAVDTVGGLIGVTGVSDHIRLRPRSESEDDIEERIQQALARNAQTDEDNIRVHTSNGKVTLRGDVRSWTESYEAERAAWLAPGVTDVTNHLKVKSGD